ncbi:hypothetical protein ACWEN3_33605 [Streptomyces sp. NPDC004561]
MQWTNQSGGAYGGEPYDGAGQPYAAGHGYGYGAATDTSTLPWEPAPHAQWTHPGPGDQGTGAVPQAPVMPLHAAGPAFATAPPEPWQPQPPQAPPEPWESWDRPRGDVLTAPPAAFDAPGRPDPGPDTPAPEPARPVFVDSSGRRQRHVLRAARLLVIPAGGYVALLIGTMLGGPSISSPFVPQPDAAHPAVPRATASDSSSGTGHSTGSAGTTARRDSRTTARQTTSGPTGRTTAPAAPPAAAPTRTSPTTTTTSGSTHARSSKGRALGSSHKPVK